ncbi:hypothetical protein LCGC14_0647840 [marine sediment metagenome]|uniref:Uncharacterized protein n=1 Tax=marine sediment metagenome TaxID=412755 RepID=A0A0F9QX75_9ZZZZ
MQEPEITLYLEISLDAVTRIENFRGGAFQKELEDKMKAVLSLLAPTKAIVSSRKITGGSLFGLGGISKQGVGDTLLAACMVYPSPVPRIDAGRVIEK